VLALTTKRSSGFAASARPLTVWWGHAQLAPDGTAAVTGFQQRVDRGMPGPDAVGESLAPPWRARLLLGRRRFVGLSLAIGDQDAKALAVAGDSPLSGLPEVVPQMPAVGDLRRLGCPGCGAFREVRRAVPANNLDPGSLCQPCGQAGRLPIRLQIHRSTGLDVDEHRAVDPSFACGVLINANHPWGRDFGFGQRIEQPQHRAAADGHPEGPPQTGASPADEGEAHRGESRPQPLCPPAMPPGQSRQLLSERPPGTRGLRAEEPLNSLLWDHRTAPARHVRGKPQVRAVHPGRLALTVRACRPGRGTADVDAYRLAAHVQRRHRHVRDGR
jgi:hypothetical protein